ncbi:MAG TPA: LysR family transcriptional regulator [Woeseiaceae bacterium]
MDWDHLRFFLAVTGSGSLAGAARALGVNHSTVFRRINAFEAELGARLFERLPEGYALTALGEAVLEEARHVDEAVAALTRSAAGGDYRLTGDIRMTTAPNLATGFVAPALARFRERYPDIRVEIAVSDSDYDLARREADLALRAAAAPPRYLVGRRIVSMPWFAFGGRQYVKKSGPVSSSAAGLSRHALIGADQAFRRLPAFDWLHRQFPREQFVATANDLNTMAALAAAGVGICILPADQCGKGLERLFKLEPPFMSDLWLLTHADLRKVARIKAFADHLFDALRADARLAEFVT